MKTFEQAVTLFQDRLAQLPEPSAADYKSKVLDLILARDQVARSLSEDPDLDSAQLRKLVALDERLDSLAEALVDGVGYLLVKRWRDSIQASESDWWWFLDKRIESKRSALIWTVLAALLLTMSIAISTEVAQRFVKSETDPVGLGSILLQVVLTIIAGSTFTEYGQAKVEEFLAVFGVRWRFQPQWRAEFSFLVFVIALGLWFSLPIIARNLYHQRGLQLQQEGKVTSALENYRRAIALYPDYAAAHYDLGTAYEDVLEYDNAISEYQTALVTDPHLYPAYNNLARLYILSRDDSNSGLKLLNAEQELDIQSSPDEKKRVQYSLYKNRGWANLNLKNLRQAASDLNLALQLRPDGAAAHCLLAQMYEARDELKSALPEWEACLRFEKGDFVEASWLSLARERLSGGQTK